MATAVTAMTATTAKVGFWPRALATIIDLVLLGIVSSILTAIVFGGDPARGNGLSTLIGLAYFLYSWSSYGHGQTLGDRALSLRVVKTDGTELTIVGALIRYLGLIVSCFALFIGVIWVAFDANKQGWHDKIAGTYVVKV